MATLAIWRTTRSSTPEPAVESVAEVGNATALLAGRLLFGGFFLVNGINHWKNREMMAGYTASKGVPAPEAAVVGTGALMFLGGLSLLLGVKPKLGAGLIAAFLAGVTPTMHAFWKDENPQERMNNQINFMKNVALLGGAALAAAIPEPWPASARKPIRSYRRLNG
jgi:uncharacterized membrane protein YphA (DoxX/SURF4 family)